MIIPLKAIVKKDLKDRLSSPSFWMIIGLSSLLWSLFYIFGVFTYVTQSMQLSTQSHSVGLNIHQHMISNYIVVLHYVLVFVVSTLSIYFFTEEKKMKTFSLYLTSPLTSWQIVAAKWFAGASVIFVILFLSALLPLSLLFFTSLPAGLFLLSYGGVFLLLCIYMSVGILASALTDSTVLCVILTLVLNILLLLMGVGRELSDIQILQELFHFLSFDYHFAQFRKGIFNLSSLLYLISWSFFISLITERVIEFHRWR